MTDITGFDLSAERRQEAADKYDIATVVEFEAGLARRPAALIISTPPNLHMGYAKAGVAAGCNVFAEAGTSSEGLLDVGGLASRKNLVAAASCTMRFQPSIARMKQLIDDGRIGRVLTYTHHCGQWLPDWHPHEDYRKFYVSRRETGACREIVPFELNWLGWLVGSPVTRLAGMNAKLSSLDCDIDDVYHLLLDHHGTTIGHLQVDVLARAPVRNCRLVGSEGTIDWSLTERVLKLYETKSGAWSSIAEPAPQIETGYSEMSNEQMYDAEIAAFIAAVRGDQPWGLSFEEDHRTLSVLQAAEMSNATGRLIHMSS